jgi:phosphonate transport system substrate-binding protein
MIFVARDSEIQTLADLNGLKWAYPDGASTSGYMYPLYMLTEAGVVPSEMIAAGNHDSAVRAVYNGEADFGTAFWSPANVDGVSQGVTLGADSLLSPDVPAELVDSCVVTEDGKQVLCGNFEVRDARRNLRAEVPDVVQKVRILAVTPAIPNDTLTFGPGFPADVRDSILNALFTFATDDPDGFKAAFSAYSWTGILPAADAEYDALRIAIQNSGYSLEDMK